MNLVKLVKLNNVQYNRNRDPQFYRVTPNQEFRVQVFLAGEGQAEISFSIEGDEKKKESLERKDAIFEYCFSFDTAGIRLGQIKVSSGNQEYIQDIRLDVVEHEWIG